MRNDTYTKIIENNKIPEIQIKNGNNEIPGVNIKIKNKKNIPPKSILISTLPTNLLWKQ